MLAVSLVPDPTLVSMLRSTEIILTMATEAVYVGSAPDPVAALGSLLVTACVGMMAAHDIIIKRLQRSCNPLKVPGDAASQ